MKISVWLLAAIIFACMAPALPAAAQTVTTLSSQYSTPQFVAVNRDKTIFVTDMTNSLSALFLVNGTYTTTPMAYDTNLDGAFISPQGVAVDQGGDVFSTSNFNSTSVGLFEFRPPDYANIYAESTTNDGGVAHGVAIDSHGNFFVADSNAVLYELSAPSYPFVSPIAIGTSGTDHPFGIAFDSHDNLFVADQLSGSGQIVELTAASGYSTGNPITAGNFQRPVGVALDSRGNLYVTDSAHNTLTELLAPNYTTAAVIDSTDFSGPMGVALDADDNIFVVDTGHNALKEIPAQPAVTGITPTAGPAAGGTTVTITGVHLTGATAVTFGGSAASSFTVASDTQVTATAPAGSGTVDVRVTTPNGTSIAAPADKYTYTSRPTVGGLNPGSGPTAGGNTVTITGTNLSNASAVSFGGTPATSVSVIGPTQISAVAPARAAGTVDVTVTTPGGTSPSGAADHYTYVAAPTVSAVSPNSGPTAGGTTAAIAGTNMTGATAVSFGGTAATSFTVNGATSITATSPTRSVGAVDVTVTTAGGTSTTGAADTFTYIAGPTVSAVAPGSGPVSGGTIVTVTGANFSGASTVKFGGAGAIWFSVQSATSILAKSPAGTGAVDVTVTTADGTSATGAADKFTYDAATNRTWVSAVSGSDANPCTVAAPCLTFAGAIANTLAGGEIDVLTPGDYGPVIITKAISIYNDGVGMAGALTTAGTSGITVNAGANDAVSLRGLNFNGLTATGASGVVFNSGAKLHIEECTFQGFAISGITFGPGSGSAATVEIVIEETAFLDNATGLLIKPVDDFAVNVALRRLKLDKNTGSGLSIDGTGGTGAINAALADSSASLNAGNGISATGGRGGVTLNMMRVVAASNGAVGIQSSQGDVGTATVTVGRSMVYGNAVGVQSVDGGALLSYANTQLTGNTSNGSFTGTASLQ